MNSGDLIQDVAVALNDPQHVRWKLADLVSWLNGGCLEVLGPRPEATAREVVLDLVTGTRQQIGEGHRQLIRVVRNVGSGRTVRLVDAATLEAALPLWHAAAPAADVQEYAWDYRSPRTFWVYPPAADGASVECTVSAYPETVPVPSDPAGPFAPFPLPDEYAEAVKAWMLYKAYMLDTGTGSNAKAQTYAQQFYYLLGVSQQGKVVNEPGETP